MLLNFIDSLLYSSVYCEKERVNEVNLHKDYDEVHDYEI
jgi:hypothetical protein